MKNDDFNKIVGSTILKSVKLLGVKAGEYATEDRLHNFKVAAVIKAETPIQSLAGMMAKHTVSVYDMCMSGKEYSKELWDEKICDSINYLLLLRALIEE